MANIFQIGTSIAGAPHESILGPLLFLIYTNDLPENLESSAKLFDDTSLFSTVYELPESPNLLNDDLKNNEMGFQLENVI